MYIYTLYIYIFHYYLNIQNLRSQHVFIIKQKVYFQCSFMNICNIEFIESFFT